MRWVDDYLEHLRNRHLVPGTVSGVRYMLDQFFLYCGKDEREVALADMEGFREYLSKKRKSTGEPFTLERQQRYVRVVAGFLKWLYRQGKILTNPFAELPPIKKPRRIPRGIITHEDVMKLLQQPNLFKPIGFRDRAMMEMLYSTGLRANELCRLMIYDIDFAARTVRVNQGKGRKDRVVPIGKVAAAYALEYLRKVRPVLLARASSWKVRSGREALTDCGVFFLSKVGKQFRSDTIWRIISQYRLKSGQTIKITSHSFRHACAIELLRGGASIRHVQEMLGHSEINTTQIYTRIVPVDLKKAHQRTSPSERRKKTETPLFEKKAWRDDKNKW
jgi:integrase/recombinase XerD